MLPRKLLNTFGCLLHSKQFIKPKSAASDWGKDSEPQSENLADIDWNCLLSKLLYKQMYLISASFYNWEKYYENVFLHLQKKILTHAQVMTLVGSHYYIWWLIIKIFQIITLVALTHLTGVL